MWNATCAVIAQIPNETIQSGVNRKPALGRPRFSTSFRTFFLRRVLWRIPAHDLSFLVQDFQRNWWIFSASLSLCACGGGWFRFGRFRRAWWLILSGLFTFRGGFFRRPTFGWRSSLF